MRWAQILLFSLLINQIKFAEAIDVVGEVEQSIQINQQLNRSLPLDHKTITLLNFELSDEEKDIVSLRVKQTLEHLNTFEARVLTKARKEQIQLGMNQTPVLDQGQHGACVVFAITAALDALLKKGDYVSQLCLLQLGQYLEHKYYLPSGWDGANMSLIFNRVRQYGVINQKKQTVHGCGGVKTYSKSSIPGTEMTTEEYAYYSEKISKQTMDWVVIERGKQIDEFIVNVKKSLKSGHRVVFSVLFPNSDSWSMGAFGWHSYLNDTWVLTSDVMNKITNNMPGHVMIITGFDDGASAMDSSGHRHHGLFTLRNSWGSLVGNWGDFYMSYDYFKTLAVSAYEMKAQ